MYAPPCCPNEPLCRRRPSTGCSAVHSAQQSASDSFHSSFRSSFKTSFLKACTDGGAPEKTCGCIEGKVEAANTDDQLMKLAAGDASK